MKHRIEDISKEKIKTSIETKKDIQASLSKTLSIFASNIGLYPYQRSLKYITLHEQLYKDINKLSK